MARRSLRQAFMAAALLIAGAGASIAAGGSPAISVAVDQVRVLRLDRDGVAVIVGNPAIADAAVHSARLIVITGKSAGATSLIALDAAGREILHTRLSVHRDAGQAVTLYKGARRHSLHCAPVCEDILAPGDDPARFDALAAAVTRTLGTARSVADGAGPLPR